MTVDEELEILKRMSSFRTDRNMNPAAITVDVALQGGLVEGTDFVLGDRFPAPSRLITAKLLGDPIALTIRVIDAIGYVTKLGTPRWTYCNIPKTLWDTLSDEQKKIVVAAHYKAEGGTAMAGLFS